MDLRNKLAKARDKWIDSEEGIECCKGKTNGQFLKNRLECAFLAGAKSVHSPTAPKLRENYLSTGNV